MNGQTESEALGERIRELRDAHGWSQGQLAAQTAGHVDQTMVSRLERGVTGEPNVFAIAWIARALGSSVEALLGFAPLDRERTSDEVIAEQDAFRQARIDGIKGSFGLPLSHELQLLYARIDRLADRLESRDFVTGQDLDQRISDAVRSVSDGYSTQLKIADADVQPPDLSKLHAGPMAVIVRALQAQIDLLKDVLRGARPAEETSPERKGHRSA